MWATFIPFAFYSEMTRRSRHFGPAILLFCTVAGVHGWSISGGLFLDDHGHWENIAKSGWSVRSLISAAELDYAESAARIWWADDPPSIRFFRPISFLIMRLQHGISYGQPAAMHIFQLMWHALAAWLVYLIAVDQLGRRDSAVVAMLVFAAHPMLVPAIQWTASQTLIIEAVFLLFFVRIHNRIQESSFWRKPTACVCLVLALLSREDAVAAPAVIMALDFFKHGKSILKIRWRWYARLWAIVAAYLAVRTLALGGFPTPSYPYYHSPAEPGFLVFVLTKTLYYLLGLFLMVPILPVAGVEYLSTNPLVSVALAGVLAALLSIIALSSRSQRFQLACLSWILLFLAPTAPLFAGSWYLYLPAIGMAWSLATWTRAWLGAEGSFGKTRYAFSACVSVILIAVCVGLSIAYGFAFRAFTKIEHVLVADVAADAAECPSNTQLFFINLPVAAHYVTPAVRRELGRDDITGWILTFAPSLMGMEQPSVLEQLDTHRFRVMLPRGRYFAGTMGKSLLAAGGRNSLSNVDEINAELFDVVLKPDDSNGFRELVFRFKKPLNSPTYRFYYGSRARWAAPISFH